MRSTEILKPPVAHDKVVAKIVVVEVDQSTEGTGAGLSVQAQGIVIEVEHVGGVPKNTGGIVEGSQVTTLSGSGVEVGAIEVVAKEGDPADGRAVKVDQNRGRGAGSVGGLHGVGGDCSGGRIEVGVSLRGSGEGGFQQGAISADLDAVVGDDVAPVELDERAIEASAQALDPGIGGIG